MKLIIICSILIVGLLALSFGPIKITPTKHPRTKNILKMRSINTALLGYYVEHKQYPETLQQLVNQGLIKQDYLNLYEGRELYYIKGLDAFKDGEKIIFHTAAEDPNDSGVVYALAAYVDGSVTHIQGYRINEILAKQEKLIHRKQAPPSSPNLKTKPTHNKTKP